MANRHGVKGGAGHIVESPSAKFKRIGASIRNRRKWFLARTILLHFIRQVDGGDMLQKEYGI
jgi:hypothetical protein